MLKTKGGYIIFDLMALALDITEESTEIEDESILKQLYSLLPYYLNKEEALKPIYIRVKNINGADSVVLAELTRSNLGLTIFAKMLECTLFINVAYEQDADTLEWSIDSATYDYLSDSTLVRNSIVGVESGTIVDAIGLDSDGELVKGSISGGTQLYKHKFYITSGNTLEFISPYNKKLKEQSIEEVKLCFGFDISGGSLGAVQGITVVKTENPTLLTLYGIREINSVLTKVSYDITSDSNDDTITPLN